MMHRHACKWKFFGVAKDRQTADTILRIAGSNDCSDLVGHTTLAELIDELRTCRLLLTNDTGTMHLCAFSGAPILLLLDSRAPDTFLPLTDKLEVLRAEPVAAIEVDDAYRASVSLLERCGTPAEMTNADGA